MPPPARTEMSLHQTEEEQTCAFHRSFKERVETLERLFGAQIWKLITALVAILGICSGGYFYALTMTNNRVSENIAQLTDAIRSERQERKESDLWLRDTLISVPQQNNALLREIKSRMDSAK